MMKLAVDVQLYDPAEGGLYGFGPLGLAGKTAGDAPTVFATFISSAVGLMTLIGIIWFVFTFITGAIRIITSGGDKNSMEQAKKKLTSGVIGLVVMLFALLIINFIGSVFGIDNILNFQYMFSLLEIK